MPKKLVAPIISAGIAFVASGFNPAAAAFAFAATFISQELQPQPRRRESGFTTTVRNAAEPRKIIYGQAKVGGTLLFMESTNNDDILHIVIELAGHPVEEIGDVYLNDDLAVAADGTVQAKFTETVTVQTNCRQEIDGEGSPTTVCDTEEQTNTFVLVEKGLGTQTSNPFPTLASEVPKWTADHAAQGRAVIYVRLRWKTELWKTGIPNISVVVKGKNDIRDPRDGSTGYTDNWALCLADYLQDTQYGFGSPDSEIDDTALIAAIEVSDEDVTLAAGGTEPRYTMNGRIDTSETHEQIIEKLVRHGAGSAVYSGGQWVIRAGAYEAPTITLDESDWVGPIQVNTKLPRSDRFNAVKGMFISEENDWQSADFPPVTNATYLAQDQGERLWRDIDLPYIGTAARAQRVAKIDLEQGRQEITVTGRAGLQAMRLRAGETVNLTLDRYGWSAKPFMVLDWGLAVQDMALGVELTLREIAAEVYDWNSGEETTQDPSPDTNLPNPFVLQAPTGLTLNSGTGQLLVAQDGTIISRIYAFWTIAPGPHVQWYDVRFRKAGREEWTQFASQDHFAFIQPVQDGALYDVQVRSANGLGAKSDWAEVTNHQVIGKTAPPSPPDTFTFLRQQDGTREFQWTHTSPPADLAGYKIRFELGSGGTWGTASALHDGLLTASPYETNALAAGTYTFLVKSIDTTGNEADTALVIIAELGDPRGAQNSIFFEDVINTGWPGTKTDAVVDVGILRARNQDTWDTLPATWDAWTVWVSNPVTSFTYQHPDIDLGIVTTVTPLISVDTASDATVEISHSDDDITYTAFAVPAGAIEARYVRVRVTVTQSGAEVPRLDGMLINMATEPVDENINDLDTSTLTGANRIGVGDIRLPIQESYGVIRTVQLALQNVGAGWSWELIDKDTATGPRVKLYNSSGTLADATIDAFIRGL